MAQTLSDSELVARCRSGDQQAWAELVDRFSRYVYAISVQAFRLPDADAEDVFQEVFARAYEHLDGLRDDAAVRPWLAIVPTADEALELAGSEETMTMLEDALTVHEALAATPEHCREILDRFFARDESYRTIGEALDLPAGTIASRISRCLVRLREFLEGRTQPDPPSSSR